MTDTPTPPPAAPATPPAPAGPTQTLSLVSFIVGIGSIVFSGISLIGLAAGIVAIILSNKAKKSEPGAPDWMKTLGLVFGIIGAILSVIFGILFLVSFIAPFIFLGTSGYYY